MKDRIIYDSVIVFDLKIVDIIDNENFHQYKEKIEEEIEIIDAKGRFVSPGFIDIHIHGGGGYDTMDGTQEALGIIGNTIAANGVTSYLPTTMTMDIACIYKALDNVRDAMKIENMGAKILGVHMEGPFINEKYKGAQKADNIIKPDYDIIKDYLDIIKIITLAP
ncbi:amidohydrolase family protein, partial [Clostridium sp.]